MINKYIYIRIYLHYISISMSIYLSLYIYINIVCHHEIPHTNYAICQDKIYIKLYRSFLWIRCKCLKARQSHYEGPVYFLPELQVLIRSILER